MKKVNGLTEGMENTHEMRLKIEQHNTEPDNNLQAYTPCSEIHDEDKDEETKYVVTFATKHTLSFLNQGDTLHIDATYQLEWNGFPVIVCGVTGGKFHGSFSVLAHDEKDMEQSVHFVHERGCHPKFRMGDGAPAITKAGEEVFERTSM